ncbi:MAG: hypothetical protein DRP50_05855 [Thermotoga sp.]|nr:MAG: hypothetical protein DRP50_05855 [Thermotoga sp.]
MTLNIKGVNVMKITRFPQYDFVFIFLILFSLSFLLSACQPRIDGKNDWITFKHDVQRTGRTTARISTKCPRILWHKDIFQERTYPVIFDGRIYFTEKSNQACYSLSQSGEIRWERSVYSNASFFYSPVITSDGIHFVTDRRLVAYNFQGERISYRYFVPISTSPLIIKDVLYIGTSNYKRLYALNLNKNYSNLWSFYAGAPVRSSPAASLDDKRICFGADNGWLYALDSKSGKLRWKYKTGGAIRSTPAVDNSDGTIYFGSNDGNLYAMDPDGSLKWKCSLGFSVDSSPAIDSKGNVYVGIKGMLYKISREGKIVWRFKTNDFSNASPTVDGNDNICVAFGDIYLVNPEGNLIWKFESSSKFHSFIIIGKDGTIYTVSDDWQLYAMR